MDFLPLGVAFIAGIVSFLSPCVLPIIPGFLAYLGGATSAAGANKGGGAGDSGSTASRRLPIFLNSLFFVIGFSLVFAALGILLNGILAHSAYAFQTWLARIGGAIIIFFGLYLMGFFHIGFLEYDHKFAPKFQSRSRYITSLLFGFAFGAGWTPCVGPVLGGILGLAASAPGEAFPLLLSYAIGLGVPFLIVGLFVSQANRWIDRYAAGLHYVTVVFGAVLVALGVLVFTQDLTLIANFDFVNNLLLRK